MSFILKSMDEGVPETLESLLGKLSHKPSYDALRVSIRFLVQHGMIDSRRNGKTVEFYPTSESYHYFRKQ